MLEGVSVLFSLCEVQEIHLLERQQNSCNLTFIIAIRESVDSLCRDDADMPRPPYIRKAYNCPDAAFVSLFR